MHTIEILTGYTFEQLREIGERFRRKRLPPRTLQHWLSKLGIERDDDGLYSESDAELIKALIKWLRRPGNTIDEFVNQLREIYGNAS